MAVDRRQCRSRPESSNRDPEGISFSVGDDLHALWGLNEVGVHRAHCQRSGRDKHGIHLATAVISQNSPFLSQSLTVRNFLIFASSLTAQGLI
jgi:hypothetical protein